MPLDPRKVVGNVVLAKACHITSDAECKRLYGSNWNTKMVQGTIVRAYQHTNISNRRYCWFVVANYELTAGRIKEKELAMRNVVAERPVMTPTTMMTTEPATQTLAAAQPLSSVAAEAAATAATMTAMAELPQQQQLQMPTSPPNVPRNLFPTTAPAATATPGPPGPPAPPPDIEQPVAESHGVRWFKENAHAHVSINGQRTI